MYSFWYYIFNLYFKWLVFLLALNAALWGFITLCCFVVNICSCHIYTHLEYTEFEDTFAINYLPCSRIITYSLSFERKDIFVFRIYVNLFTKQ